MLPRAAPLLSLPLLCALASLRPALALHGDQQLSSPRTCPTAHGRGSDACVSPGVCTPPSAALHSAVATGPAPALQWDISGGFCGSFSLQQAAYADPLPPIPHPPPPIPGRWALLGTGSPSAPGSRRTRCARRTSTSPAGTRCMATTPRNARAIRSDAAGRSCRKCTQQLPTYVFFQSLKDAAAQVQRQVDRRPPPAEKRGVGLHANLPAGPRVEGLGQVTPDKGAARRLLPHVQRRPAPVLPRQLPERRAL